MKIYSIQKSRKSFNELSEIFVIEPLSSGQGITIGNTLRRILLSETYGFAISGVKINNVKHELDNPNFLREDVLELLLNLKQISLMPLIKNNCSLCQQSLNYTSLTKIKGPVVVTAGMLNIPNQLQILNPNQYICTIIDNSELSLLLSIQYDKNYKTFDELKEKNLIEESFLDNSSYLKIDAYFNPIKKVNYKIKLIRDEKGNLKESIFFEIITNGTITPKKALLNSINFCLKLFYPLLVKGLNLNKTN